MEDPEAHLQKKLEDRLKALGVWYEFVPKSEATVHTADAAQVTGIPLSTISKNLMSKASDGSFAALILPGDCRVDLKAAARALGVSNLQLVQFAQAHTVSGFPPGGTPSLGFDLPLKVVLDAQLASLDSFYCGGGSTRMLLKLKRADVMRFNNAVSASIAKRI